MGAWRQQASASAAHALALLGMLCPPIDAAGEVGRVAGAEEGALVQRELGRGGERRVGDDGHEPRGEGLSESLRRLLSHGPWPASTSVIWSLCRDLATRRTTTSWRLSRE